ncbi:MAG: D-alanine--D-serine ligase VanG [Roseburia sp.]|nr:D-alanine--D-serine ligase VanG [Roseburia sp.]
MEIKHTVSKMRKQIAILFGGCSPEYEVSLQSAYSVINHLNPIKYKPIPIGITPGGDWYLFQGSIEKIASDTWQDPKECVPVAVLPNRTEHALLLYGNEGVEKLDIDAAFPILHGRNGEDGTVQGLFELARIPLVGCGTLCSALCMDKDRAHKMAASAGIRVPKAFTARMGTKKDDIYQMAEEIGYPLFVKPVKAGSSYGVSKVPGHKWLFEAVESAFRYDTEIILEECISGFETGCAIMGGESLMTGEIDEIELASGFFDYEEKYSLMTSSIHVPARVTPEMAEKIKETAKTIYRALDCRGFARVDLFVTDEEELIFNEVNTIPGFTLHSRFPNMMKAAGITLEQVISMAIEAALDKAAGQGM